MSKLEDTAQQLLDAMVNIASSEEEADGYEMEISFILNEANIIIGNAQNCALDGLVTNFEQYFIEKASIEKENEEQAKRTVPARQAKEMRKDYFMVNEAIKNFHDAFEEEFNVKLHTGCMIERKDSSGHIIGEPK